MDRDVDVFIENALCVTNADHQSYLSGSDYFYFSKIQRMWLDLQPREDRLRLLISIAVDLLTCQISAGEIEETFRPAIVGVSLRRRRMKDIRDEITALFEERLGMLGEENEGESDGDSDEESDADSEEDDDEEIDGEKVDSTVAARPLQHERLVYNIFALSMAYCIFALIMQAVTFAGAGCKSSTGPF